LIAALTLGLIFAVLAIGVYISFKIFNIPDITAEGSITLGGAVAAALIVSGIGPVTATVSAVLAGVAAGLVTGVMATRFAIQPLLAGILTMTALYSINLRVMDRSNLPLTADGTLVTYADTLGGFFFGTEPSVTVAGWTVGVHDLSVLLSLALLVLIIALTIYWFFRTELGSAMRASGDNPQMIEALGVSAQSLAIGGLAISNGLIALSGALLAQYQGFADVQMGIGVIVLGLASVIIGEALVGSRSLGLMIAGAIMGAVLFRLLVAMALRWGMNPNDLKLITAVFVFLALVGPLLVRRFNAPKVAQPVEG
jgi:putative tryptophan/tyrosine transport system permease protein